MRNHYLILGLNSNGLDGKESRYGISDIKKAYKNRALGLHPDKNLNSDKNNGFSELQESYNELMNPKKRAAFDLFLEENPGLADQNHLFVEIDSDSNFSNVREIQRNSNELVPFKSTEVDLTKLIENAEYTGEAILALARRNPLFAKALLDNPSTFVRLSSTQRFELLIIIQQRSDAEEFANCLQKATVKSLKLKKYEMELVNLCLQQKKKNVAVQLIESLKLLEKLSYKALLALSQGFYEAVPVLLKKYSHSLNIVSLEFIFNKHSDPEHKKAIKELLKKYSPEKEKHFRIYNRFKKMATEGKLLRKLEGEYSILKIKELGLDALLISQHLPNDISIFLYNCQVLNILLSEKKPKLLKDLSLEDLETIQSTLLEILSYSVVILKSFGQGIIFLDQIPQEDIFFLLSRFSNKSFFYLISKIEFKNCSKTITRKYTNFFLMNGQSGPDDEPLLLKGLNDLNENAWSFLEKNKKVVEALLKNTYYQKALATTTHLNMQKKLAKLIAKLGIDVNILPIQKFPQYHQLILAYQKLYAYLINNKENARKLTWKEFESAYQVTGFFDDLLKIPAYDSEIECNIVFNITKDVLIEIRDNGPPSEKNSKYSVYLFVFFLNVLIRQNDDQRKELAKLYELKDVRKFLLRNVYGGIKPFIGEKYFAKQFIAFLHFVAQCSQYTDFSIGFLETLSKIIESDSFIKRRMLASFELFRDIDWDDRKLISEPNDEIADDKLDEHFKNICSEFKEKLLPKYPKTFFSRVIEFYDSDFYNHIIKEKLGTFEKLSKILCEIKPEPLSYQCANKTLNSLYDLILKTGIDSKVRKKLKEKLRDTNPSLLSALLTLALEDSRISIISSKKVNNLLGNIKLNEPLEQAYLLLAEKYLNSYRNTVEGDVLVKMAETHGERIIPLFRKYGLYSKFLNGIKLKNYFSKIGQGTGQIRNQAVISVEHQTAVSVEQLNQNLYNQFKTLIENYTVTDTDKHSHSTQMHDYHLILTENIEQHEIQDPTLQQLGAHYPYDDSDNLLQWIVALAFGDNPEAKKKLKSLITNAGENTKPKIYSTIFSYLKKFDKLEKISYTDITFFFSDEFVPDLVIFYFKSELSKDVDYVPQFILDYFETKFTLEKLEKLDEVMPDFVISYFKFKLKKEVDHIPHFILYYFNTRFELEKLGELDETDLTNLNKMIEAYLSKEKFSPNLIEGYLKKKFSSKHEIIQPLKKVERFLQYLFPSVAYNRIEDLCPLLCSNLLKSEDVNSLNIDSLHYRAYKKLADCQLYQANESHIKKIKLFFESEYFKFIQTNVLDDFDKECKRLTDDGGSEKANYLKTVKTTIEESLLDGLTEKGFDTLSYPIVNQAICKKIVDFSSDSKIDKARRETRAFLKKIAGVLIAVPLLGVPLLSRRYCAFFFKTTTAAKLEIISEKVHDFRKH